MKLACSSSAFDELLRSGALTQLEWLDCCAHELAADGVVFDVRHFPRTDTDYLAQIKKMSADLGLTVAALWDTEFLRAGADAMDASLERALAIGAPLLAAPLAMETAMTWSQALERLNDATMRAKRANVTIALRNAPETFAAGSLEMKRVTKEADSAWLRYGPEFGALEAGSDAAALVAKTVLAWVRIDGSAALPPELRERFLGFAVLDQPDGQASVATAKEAFVRLRAVDRA